MGLQEYGPDDHHTGYNPHKPVRISYITIELVHSTDSKKNEVTGGAGEPATTRPFLYSHSTSCRNRLRLGKPRGTH